MQVGFIPRNACDENGNPTGGVVVGTGFTLAWQDGPLGRGEDRMAPNGAFVEDVLAACRQRLQFFQDASDGKFACEENVIAINAITEALEACETRVFNREARGVEGTHKP